MALTEHQIPEINSALIEAVSGNELYSLTDLIEKDLRDGFIKYSSLDKIVPPDTPDGVVERVISMIEECGLSVQRDDHED